MSQTGAMTPIRPHHWKIPSCAIALLFAKRGGAARCDLKLPGSTDHLVATPSTRGAAPSAGQIPAAPE